MSLFRPFNILLLATLLNLVACASIPVDAPTYKRLPVAESNNSHLYFYRLGALPRLRTPSVLVDGKLVFDPPEGAYTVITLPTGAHTVKIDWAADTMWPDLEFPITLTDGGVLYLKITGSIEYLPGIDRLGSKVVPMTQEKAEKELSQCCRYIAPSK